MGKKGDCKHETVGLNTREIKKTSCYENTSKIRSYVYFAEFRIFFQKRKII